MLAAVVIVEFNGRVGGERAVVVPYDPEFDRHRLGAMYYGASLAAFAHLASRKGYRLIAVEPNGNNAYFLRNDVAPHIPASAPADVFVDHQVSARKEKVKERRKRQKRSLYEYIALHNLLLVEL